MPALGDDVDEGGDGGLGLIPNILALICLVVVVAIMALPDARAPAAAAAEEDEGDGVADRRGGTGDEVEHEGGDELDCMEAGHAPAAAPSKKRRYYSIAHEDLADGRVVYIHVDLEYDTYAGILQISAVFMDQFFNVTGEFNEYVRPPNNARWDDKLGVHGLTRTDPRILGADSIHDVWRRFVHAVESRLLGDKVGMMLAWNGKASDCTKLFELTEIWHKELDMPRGIVYFGDPMIAIAGYRENLYNNKWRMPGVPEGYGLAMVYRIVFGEPLADAHNSIADARAQAALFSHPLIQQTFDRVKCVEKMEEVWKGKQKRQAEYEAEPTRTVPLGWTDKGEDTFEVPRTRSYKGPAGGGEVGPSSQMRRACGNRDLGDLFMFFFPTQLLKTIAKETNRYGNEDWVRPGTAVEWRRQNDPASNETEEPLPRTRSATREPSVHVDMSAMEGVVPAPNPNVFIGIRPGRALEVPSGGADDGGPEDDSSNESSDPEYTPEATWDSESEDGSYFSDGDDESIDSTNYEREPKKKVLLIPCDKNHPQARKRYMNATKPWVPVTLGYLLAWFGILILLAAMKLRSYKVAWMESYGFGVPVIQNTMPRHRFDQIRRFIHFANNKRMKRKGQPGWNPLQKIKPIIEGLLARFRAGYVIGQFMSVDESMIRYKGKQIRFVQYMPAKPIRHGVKVFCLCCAETGYMYGCWVYCGKENDNASPTEIVERLLRQDSSFLGSSAGRVLYTDNYYTGEALMKYMYMMYGMFVVGTIGLTKKKSRTADDFAFHKLSGPATRTIDRGWVRWAQKKVTDGAGHLLYIIQNTTWMDRQQVGVMHNWKVGGPGECMTLRYDRNKRERLPFPSHPIIPDYIRYMGGVDRCDRGMHDFDVSQKGSRWYCRVFYYMINAALYNMRVCTKGVVELAKLALDRLMPSSDNKDPWEKYVSGDIGWFKWMCDLGLRLIEIGIEMDWPDISDPAQRPKWLRQLPFKACPCNGVCFFCKNNLTGKYGPPVDAPANPTLGQKRGHPVEVARDHVVHPVRIFDNSRDCGVCLQQGRIRKPPGVERDHHHINRCVTGCHHLHCKKYPVCKDHWNGFRHKWN